MEGEKTVLTKLRQIEEHARALTGELPAGHAQNRARQIAILAAHAALTLEMTAQPQPAAALRTIPPR